MLKVFPRGTIADRALSRGAFVAFATQISAVGIGYLAHVLLARWMGVTEYGIYIYALGWAVPLTALGGLGVHMVALRFVPAYVSSADWSKVRGSYRAGAGIAIAAGIVVAVASLAVLAAISSKVSNNIGLSLAIALTLVPLLSVTHFHTSFLRALKRVGWANASDVIRPPILVAGAGMAVMVTGGVTASTLLLVLGGGLVLVICIQYLLVRSALPKTARTVPAKTDFPAWKRAVGAMLLIEVFQAVMVKADILLLGAMIDVDAVAIFGVAARVAGLVGFVVSAVSTMAGPMFTELHAAGKRADLSRLVKTAANWMLFPSLAMVAALVFFSSSVLGLFGEDFVAGTTTLWILLAAQLVHAVAGPVFVLITFTGFHKNSARIYGYMLGLNIVLNIVGIRFFGIEGAAYAALITAITWSILLHRSVSSNLHLAASPIVRLLTVRSRRDGSESGQ